MKDVKKTDFLVRLDNKTTSMDTIDLVNYALSFANSKLKFVTLEEDNDEGSECINYALISDVRQSEINSDEYMNLHIKMFMDLAIENNVICYDAFCKPGEFSDRLVVVCANALNEISKGEKINIIIRDYSGDLTEYYKASGSTFPPEKNRIALFISKNNCILGAY